MNKKLSDTQYEALRTQAFNIPNLEPDELERLLLLAKAGNVEAANKIILSHLKYAFSYVEKHYEIKQKAVREGCVTEAYFALYSAIKGYKFGKGASFATYAGYWIRKYVSLKFEVEKRIMSNEINDIYVENQETSSKRINYFNFEKWIEVKYDTDIIRQLLAQDKRIQERDRIIFEIMIQKALYENRKFKQDYAARALGITRQAVGKRVAKIREILIEMGYKDELYGQCLY